MLLRASAEHDQQDYDLTALTAGGDGGIEDGAMLGAFAEAVLGCDATRLESCRQAILKSLGAEALVDAAAVVATFNSTDRMADATGTPLEEYKRLATAELRQELGIDKFANN